MCSPRRDRRPAELLGRRRRRERPLEPFARRRDRRARARPCASVLPRQSNEQVFAWTARTIAACSPWCALVALATAPAPGLDPAGGVRRRSSPGARPTCSARRRRGDRRQPGLASRTRDGQRRRLALPSAADGASQRELPGTRVRWLRAGTRDGLARPRDRRRRRRAAGETAYLLRVGRGLPARTRRRGRCAGATSARAPSRPSRSEDPAGVNAFVTAFAALVP